MASLCTMRASYSSLMGYAHHHDNVTVHACSQSAYSINGLKLIHGHTMQVHYLAETNALA